MVPNADLNPFDRLLAFAQSAAGTLHVKSALNPMLWLCAIVSLPSFGLAWIVSDNTLMSFVLLGLGSVPVFGTVAGFLYFMVKCPEKLQSEEYQIKHQALEIIQSKGSQIEIMPLSIEGISNPAPKQITNGDQP